ncbi:MAG: DUF2442 domain-containing protein [Thiohalocapsa sp.]
MQIPRIKTVEATPGHILVVTFTDGTRKSYNVGPLTKREMFAPLKDEAFFRNVQVESGGYAVSWSSDIDISEYELWQHGKLMP